MTTGNVTTQPAESKEKQLLLYARHQLDDVARDLEATTDLNFPTQLTCALHRLEHLTSVLRSQELPPWPKTAFAGHPVDADPENKYMVEDDAGYWCTFVSQLENNAFLHVACQFLERKVGVLVKESFKGWYRPKPVPHAVFQYGPFEFSVYRRADALELIERRKTL